MEGATTRDILERALLVRALPDSVQDIAGRLVDKMGRPVRVTLLGLPGSGKSSIVNLLAGKIVVPESVNLPTTQLIKGKSPRATLTLPDGTSEVLEDATAEAISEKRPVFVEMELDLPALGKISILEVVTGVNRSQQSRAALWAAKRTDLAIWCTRSFTPAEQATWAGLPDHLKDNGILLRTRADEFGDPFLWPGEMGELEQAAQGEFRAVLPIATLEALAARQTGGAVDKARFRASGAPGLISTVLKVVDLGQQALIDQADVILHKYKIDASVFDLPIPEDEPEVEEEEELPEDEVDAVETAEDDLEDDFADDHDDDHDDDEDDEEIAAIDPAAPQAPPPEPEPKWSETAVASIMARLSGNAASEGPAAPAAEPAIRAVREEATAAIAPASNVADDIWGSDSPAEKVSGLSAQEIEAATAEALRAAIDRLTRVGSELLDGGELTPSAVMNRSVDEMQWLSDHLDATEADDDVIEAARTAAMDAADLVQLMQIEKRDSAATEAISLLIQMRRGFRQTLAAA